VTQEDSYYVETTLGTYTIAEHIFPANPQNWRSSHSVPDDVPRGVPALWAAAKQRLDSGDPGPVTAQRDYQNYILASQATILHKYSASIDRYKQEKLLPD